MGGTVTWDILILLAGSVITVGGLVGSMTAYCEYNPIPLPVATDCGLKAIEL